MLVEVSKEKTTYIFNEGAYMEKQILFLSGLGSHRLFLKDLNNQLDNMNLVQIDLPGHGLNLDVIVNDLNELVEWFKTEIKIYDNEELTIVGHSLGRIYYHI